MNDPVTAKSTGLPSGVAHTAPAPTATPVVKYDTYTLTVDNVAATANNVVLLDVSSLIDAGAGDRDTLTYNDDDIGAGDPLLVARQRRPGAYACSQERRGRAYRQLVIHG